MAKILTIDDEAHLLELLKYHLESHGFEVVQALTAKEGMAILQQQPVDLLILDCMLPEVDGLTFLRQLRKNQQFFDLPIIMLTARNEEIDTVLGLEMGADDYVGKPFSSYELMARVKALLRRVDVTKGEEDSKFFEVGNIMVDAVKRQIKVDGKQLELPLKEFELLLLLIRNPGRVFDRETLLEKVWGYDYYGETRTVDVHIRNLRKKIEFDDSRPLYIKTVRGVGYKFTEVE